MQAIQYTIRNVPDPVDAATRKEVQVSGKSLNHVLIDAVARGLGIAEKIVEYHDLDHLSGTWEHDREFDAALEAFEQVDEDLWK